MSLRQSFASRTSSEGLTLTMLESMAHGLAVAVTSVRGNPEVVEQGKTGFLVPPKDPHALANSIVEIARQPSLALELWRRGRERAERRFREPAAAEEYRRLNQTLTDERT